MFLSFFKFVQLLEVNIKLLIFIILLLIFKWFFFIIKTINSDYIASTIITITIIIMIMTFSIIITTYSFYISSFRYQVIFNSMILCLFFLYWFKLWNFFLLYGFKLRNLWTNLLWLIKIYYCLSILCLEIKVILIIILILLLIIIIISYHFIWGNISFSHN